MLTSSPDFTLVIVGFRTGKLFHASAGSGKPCADRSLIKPAAAANIFRTAQSSAVAPFTHGCKPLHGTCCLWSMVRQAGLIGHGVLGYLTLLLLVHDVTNPGTPALCEGVMRPMLVSPESLGFLSNVSFLKGTARRGLSINSFALGQKKPALVLLNNPGLRQQSAC